MRTLYVLSAFAQFCLVVSAEFICASCVCKETTCNGLVADCGSLRTKEDFRNVSQNLPSNIETLILNGQPLHQLTENVFQNANLTGLKGLRLQFCKISDIHRNTFRRMSQLKRLYLSDNDISSIDDGTLLWLVNLEFLKLTTNSMNSLPDLSKLTKLKTLLFGNNNISVLDENSFVHNAELRTLELDSNNIEILPNKLVNNLKNLNKLQLSANNLSTLPETLLQNLVTLEYIIVQHNKISKFPEGIFQDTYNLKVIDFSKNEIEVIPQNIFTNLTKLNELSLQFNKIKALNSPLLPYLNCSKDFRIHLEHNNINVIPIGIFTKPCSFYMIDLSFNNISSIKPYAFSDINIKYFRIHYNNIEFLHQNTFKNSFIEHMTFTNNKLTVLPDGIFESVRISLHLTNNMIQTFSSHWFGYNLVENVYLNDNNITYFEISQNYHDLQLHDNPIICDCKILKQFEFTKRHNVHVSMPCSDPPHLKNKYWLDLTPDQLACKPKILDSIEIRNGTGIACKVYGSPTVDVIWKKNNERLDKYNPDIKETKANLPGDTYWYNLTFSGSGNHGGQYTCEVSNAAGNDTASFDVPLQAESPDLNESNVPQQEEDICSEDSAYHL